jgi:hypothetical protein
MRRRGGLLEMNRPEMDAGVADLALLLGVDEPVRSKGYCGADIQWVAKGEGAGGEAARWSGVVRERGDNGMGTFTTAQIVAAMVVAALATLVVFAVRGRAREAAAMREFAALAGWKFNLDEAPLREIIDPVLKEIYGGAPFTVTDIIQAPDIGSTYLFRCSGTFRPPRRELRVCCMAEKSAGVPAVVWMAIRKPGTERFVRDHLDPAVPGFQERFLVASTEPGVSQALLTPQLQRAFLSGLAGLDEAVEIWITGRWILTTTLSDSPRDWDAVIRATRNLQNAMR